MIKGLLISLGVFFSPPDLSQICDPGCSISQAGIAIIQNAEGYSPYPYKDAVGIWTIGFGHVILPGEKFDKPLLPDEATKLLMRDILKKERHVNTLVVSRINQAQFDALTSFTFNLGEAKLKKSTLLKRVNAARHSEVPGEFNKWVFAGNPPRKLRGLIIRRAAEASLYALDLN